MISSRNIQALVISLLGTTISLFNARQIFAQQTGVYAAQTPDSTTATASLATLRLRAMAQKLHVNSSIAFNVVTTVSGRVKQDNSNSQSTVTNVTSVSHDQNRSMIPKNSSWNSFIIIESSGRFAATTTRSGQTTRTTASGPNFFITNQPGKYIKDQLPMSRSERVKHLLLRGTPALSMASANIFAEDIVSLGSARISGNARINDIECTELEISPDLKPSSANQALQDSTILRIFIGDKDDLPYRVERETVHGAYKIIQTEDFKNFKLNVQYPPTYFITTPAANETVVAPIRSPRTFSATQNGSFAPNFSVKNALGKELTLESLRGKYVLLQFWGSWCSVCQQDWETIKKWKQLIEGNRLIPISINLDSEPSIPEARTKVQQAGVDWLNTMSGQGWNDPLAKAYEVHALPCTLLIGPDGRVVSQDAPLDDMLQLLHQPEIVVAQQPIDHPDLVVSTPSSTKNILQSKSATFSWLKDRGLHIQPEDKIAQITSNVASFNFDVVNLATPGTATKTKHTFHLKNESAQPLVIRKVSGSCGCIVVSDVRLDSTDKAALLPLTVQPNATISATVELDLVEAGLDNIRGKYGLIFIDGEPQAVAALEITGKLAPLVHFEPETIELNGGTVGKGAVASVKVIAADPALRTKLATQITLESDSPYVKALPLPVTGDGSTIEYKLELSKNAPIGASTANLHLAPRVGKTIDETYSRLRSMNLPVSISVKGPVSAKPAAVVFMSPGTDRQTSSFTQSVQIVLTAQKDGMIDDMQIASGSPWLFVHIAKQNARTALLTVTLNENAPKGLVLQTEILLRFVSSKVDMVLPVTGEVKKVGRE